MDGDSRHVKLVYWRYLNQHVARDTSQSNNDRLFASALLLLLL